MYPISVKKYKELQDIRYKEYCDKCISNGVNPEPQSKYFFKPSVNYGYIMEGACNSIIWKKRKRDFYKYNLIK